MKLQKWDDLSRNPDAIYVNCHHQNCLSIAFIGSGNDFIQRAVELVMKHREKHSGGSAQTDATWLTGKGLDELWLGQQSRQKYSLVEDVNF
ncbi:MAG: hypothetical protein UR23_C0010G0006 [Candidatus Roizmanbacteria bacterium GW2011_GWA2_32_13]|uniref:Uncharacterized protein n=1 Tax=Candidatus Roizmanbacteria bacterium GW2011_GWA2_32_13 TaxID=1618475 RepID=A0A0G0C109_9BACT|nr:MAG: hypothetical protein UR23_C0010G0006 [Candidatus Roizmanbacteria bacterium GW2011_GWA2_32_13]